jgi:hypothetical protein
MIFHRITVSSCEPPSRARERNRLEHFFVIAYIGMEPLRVRNVIVLDWIQFPVMIDDIVTSLSDDAFSGAKGCCVISCVQN